MNYVWDSASPNFDESIISHDYYEINEYNIIFIQPPTWSSKKKQAEVLIQFYMVIIPLKQLTCF